MQQPFDAAVVMTTLLRPTLTDALMSVFRQGFRGRIHTVLGVDKPLGDRAALDAALAHRPPNHAVTFLDLGYSTSTRHGGQHLDNCGGALRTVLSYLANSRYVAYLDDDNWMHEAHLGSLRAVIGGHHWAFSMRWYCDDAARRPLCVDQWESIGPGRGVQAKEFGGWVDPNCIMIDKTLAEPVLRYWSVPMPIPGGSVPSDRSVFDQLRRLPWICTGLPTSFYSLQPTDANYHSRMDLVYRHWHATGLPAGAPQLGIDPSVGFAPERR
jgi:hypothetical protein